MDVRCSPRCPLSRTTIITRVVLHEISQLEHIARVLWVAPQTLLFEIRAYYGGIGNMSVRPSLTFPVRTPVTDLVEPRYSSTQSGNVIAEECEMYTRSESERKQSTTSMSLDRLAKAYSSIYDKYVVALDPEYSQTRAADDPIRGGRSLFPNIHIFSR